MDPTLLAILSIFGGASLTAGAGFFGAWLQSRREHARWLREQRYEAYARLIAHQLHFDVLNVKVDRLGAQLDTASPEQLTVILQDRESLAALIDEQASAAPEAVTAVYLLGSIEVKELAAAYLQGRADGEYRAAEAAFLSAMRRSIGVKD